MAVRWAISFSLRGSMHRRFLATSSAIVYHSLRAKQANSRKMEPEERDPVIAKYLASCGFCSRRKALEILPESDITIDGVQVQGPSTRVPRGAEVLVSGVRVKPLSRPRLFLYHKRAGVVVSTISSNPGKLPTVFDVVNKEHKKLSFPRLLSVGRLDINATGLLILTTSPKIAHALTLPHPELSQVYHLKIRGEYNWNKEELYLKRRAPSAQPSATSIRLLEKSRAGAWVETVLPSDGKNRSIRKLARNMRVTVVKIKRTQFGQFDLRGIPLGGIREVVIPPFVKRILDLPPKDITSSSRRRRFTRRYKQSEGQN